MDEPTKKRFFLKKENILRERKKFKQAFSSGRKLENRYFQIICNANTEGKTRVAVILSRKFGKATVRNQIRRRIKEVYRLKSDLFPSSTDCIIRPRSDVRYISFHELEDSLLHLIKKCVRKTIFDAWCGQ